MKVLFLHTYYLQRGGEDAVFEQDINVMKQALQTRYIRFQNKKGLRGALQFFLSIWNIWAGRKLAKELQEHKPDLIHLHNLHFAIGPIAIRIAKKAGIPVVLTLHNFRLLNPSGILTPGSNLQAEINSSFPWKAVYNKVYRNSLLQTFWLAFIIWFHKKIGTWQLVDKFHVHTSFSKSIFIKAIPEIGQNKYFVTPNFVYPAETKPIQKEKHFLFVGRLSQEKGITVLLDSFNNPGYKLSIAGDGPLTETVKMYCKNNKNVHYLGRLKKEEVLKEMARCTALIFPSTWYEGMPVTILEAFSLGVPVIASDVGAMSVMVNHGHNGLLFEMGNPDALVNQLRYWESLNVNEKNIFSQNAKKEFEEKYTPMKYKKQMLEVYSNVLQHAD
jgi:glycosyltransferase involved in cell wall biosynthesis